MHYEFGLAFLAAFFSGLKEGVFNFPQVEKN